MGRIVSDVKKRKEDQKKKKRRIKRREKRNPLPFFAKPVCIVGINFKIECCVFCKKMGLWLYRVSRVEFIGPCLNRRSFKNFTSSFFLSRLTHREKIKIIVDTSTPLSYLAGWRMKNYTIQELRSLTFYKVAPSNFLRVGSIR